MPVASQAHAMADANAVLAALTVLTGASRHGVVRADEPFHPSIDHDRDALLRAAAVMQTEVSLSIFASDPFLGEAASELADFRQHHPEAPMERLVEEIDKSVHELVTLLNGRAAQLHEISRRLTTNGELTLADVELILAD